MTKLYLDPDRTDCSLEYPGVGSVVRSPDQIILLRVYLSVCLSLAHLSVGLELYLRVLAKFFGES